MAHWTTALNRQYGHRITISGPDLAARLRRMDMMKDQMAQGTDHESTPTPNGFRIGSGRLLEEMGITDPMPCGTLSDGHTDSPTPILNITMDFIKAGKAIFTVDNGKGTHYTYKVTRKEDGSKIMYFVGLLTGPDNNSNYTYMGMLVNDNLYTDTHGVKRVFCKLTRASTFNNSSTPVRVLNWALDVIQGLNNGLPDGYSIQREGR